MIIQEHNEDYCRTEITDAEGRKQTLKKCIIVDLSDEAIEMHLINLNEVQKKLIFEKIFVNAETTLCRG